MRRDDRGQATVEVALALPVVIVLLLVAAQVVAVARDQITVIHAARELARAAAVDPNVDSRAALGHAVTLEPARVQSAVSIDARWANAEVRYRSPTDVPIVGALVPDVVVSARASMQREPEAPP